MENKNKEEIIRAATSMDFRPVEIPSSDVFEKYKKIPMTELAGMGSFFAEMIPEFRTVTGTTTINAEGLYRCTFPKGVTGKLAAFKDGSGSMGTIVNSHGIAGQARWNKIHSITGTQKYTVPISPLSMFMAATMVEMNHKLDKIQKLGEEILSYQKQKDRAKQKADFEQLLDVYEKFKYNIQNETWQKLKYNYVQFIKRDTSAQMKHLRGQIDASMNKHDLFHTNMQTDQMIRKVQSDFIQYRLSVFMYAFSTFLETLLLNNFSEDYLKAICHDINDCAVAYREYYTDCYNKLMHSSQTTIGSGLLKGISSASGNVGRAIHKIPVIEKGPLDEFLVDTGRSIDQFGKEQTDKTLYKFRQNMTSGAEQFSDELEIINRLYNSPMDVLIDNDAVYLKIISE